MYTELNDGPFSIVKETSLTGLRVGKSSNQPILKFNILLVLALVVSTKIPIGIKVLTKLNGVSV